MPPYILQFKQIGGILIAKLIVAEKPSTAQAYAKVLGATNRQDGYWEGNGYLVSWCIGHLVELAPPNVYDEKYVKWSVADLPILPEKWQYLVSASTKKQFGILKKLMNRPDVDSVTAATDAGREGELIFRLVYQQTGCKKSVSRLWLSSMEESAIREGFANLKPSTEYDALYNAALCRERADWMVGINASRLFSCLYGRPLAVGRVMTPVLAMTVVREAEIAAFTPEKFYTVVLAFAGGGTASSKRFSQKADAEALLTSCRKEVGATVQNVERKEKSENPPQLYDLTTLQRDANRLLGFTAQQTLNYAQSLYEKKIDYLSPHRQPIFDGGYGRIAAGPCIRNGCDFWRRRKTSGSCAAGNQRKQGHGPPRAAAYGKCGKGRPFRTACRGAECPAADCDTVALCRGRAVPLCRNRSDHDLCRGRIFGKRQGGVGRGLEKH